MANHPTGVTDKSWKDWLEEDWGPIYECPFVGRTNPNTITAKAFRERDPPLPTCAHVCHYFGINAANAAAIIEDRPTFDTVSKNIRKYLGSGTSHTKILQSLLQKLATKGDPPLP